LTKKYYWKKIKKNAYELKGKEIMPEIIMDDITEENNSYFMQVIEEYSEIGQKKVESVIHYVLKNKTEDSNLDNLLKLDYFLKNYYKDDNIITEIYNVPSVIDLTTGNVLVYKELFVLPEDIKIIINNIIHI
jgi:sulfatase maturation enzyme AslB (radical SAM superfamily)